MTSNLKLIPIILLLGILKRRDVRLRTFTFLLFILCTEFFCIKIFYIITHLLLLLLLIFFHPRLQIVVGGKPFLTKISPIFFISFFLIFKGKILLANEEISAILKHKFFQILHFVKVLLGVYCRCRLLILSRAITVSKQQISHSIANDLFCRKIIVFLTFIMIYSLTLLSDLMVRIFYFHFFLFLVFPVSLILSKSFISQRIPID